MHNMKSASILTFPTDTVQKFDVAFSIIELLNMCAYVLVRVCVFFDSLLVKTWPYHRPRSARIPSPWQVFPLLFVRKILSEDKNLSSCVVYWTARLCSLYLGTIH